MNKSSQIKSYPNIERFIFGGNATFTLKNPETNNRFTFKLRTPKDNNTVYFVSVFNGTDNNSHYKFIGTIFTDSHKPKTQSKFFFSKKSKLSEDTQSVKVFKWFYEKFKYNKVPKIIEFWHEGRCGCCGRKLTVPESIESGIGPVCDRSIK